MGWKKSLSAGPISASVEVSAEPESWQTERAACAEAIAALNDGGWNALREVLRRGGFEKLYKTGD